MTVVLREQAERVLALDAEATPGPWRHTDGTYEQWDLVWVDEAAERFIDASHDVPIAKHDAALIAEFRTLAPALAREVLRLQAVEEAARRAV